MERDFGEDEDEVDPADDVYIRGPGMKEEKRVRAALVFGRCFAELDSDGNRMRCNACKGTPSKLLRAVRTSLTHYRMQRRCAGATAPTLLTL